ARVPIHEEGNWRADAPAISRPGLGRDPGRRQDRGRARADSQSDAGATVRTATDPGPAGCAYWRGDAQVLALQGTGRAAQGGRSILGQQGWSPRGTARPGRCPPTASGLPVETATSP